MGPSLNRNRFSAVATISVPTLGIKGKKIGKKEKYVETIDPAPSTPAGEPLGEIEIEVTAEVANKLPESWPIEVSKNEEQTQKPTPALLGTTFPQELPLIEKKNQDTPILPETTLAQDEEQEEGVTPTPPSPLAQTLPSQEENCPTPREEPVSNKLMTQTSSLPNPSKPSKPTPPAHIDSEEKNQDAPALSTATPAKEALPPPPSAVSETAPSKDESLLTPQPEPTPHEPPHPSLFRSRSFAALIDFSVAVCFFVIGVLLFPDPPRIFPFLFAALYLLTKDSLGILNGQSIGKKMMKLRVVNRRNRVLTGNYKTGLIRNLSWLLAPIEFAILYVREDEPTIGQRLGDDWAKTRVVSEEAPKPRKSKWLP